MLANGTSRGGQNPAVDESLGRTFGSLLSQDHSWAQVSESI